MLIAAYRARSPVLRFHRQRSIGFSLEGSRTTSLASGFSSEGPEKRVWHEDSR